MSDYTGPGMTAEFFQTNQPGAKLPASLKVILVGRPIHIEEDVYLGAYTYASGLSSTAIPSIPDDASLLGDDFITVAIQLTASGEIVTVPEASWTRTTTNIVIDANLVNELVDKTAAANRDGTLTVASRLFESVAVDFDEIGVVQNYTLLTLVDADGLEYPAYNAILASGTDAGKLYIPGTAATIPLPELKLTVNNTTNFSIGDDVTQAVSGATGTIVNINGATTMVLGNVTGTFTATGANAITNTGTGSCTASAKADLSSIDWGFSVALKMDGDARISHKSLRTDLCDTITKVTTDTILDVFTNDYSITPDGDLGFGAKIGTDVAQEIYVIGVNDLAGAIDDSNATASRWNEAFAYLKLQAQSDCAYQYVVMSENSEVHAYMDLFISWMRTPAKSKIAIGWSSFKAEFMDYVIDATSLPTSHGTGTALSISGETFQTKGCLDGGYFIFRNPADSDDDTTIRAVSIDSETDATLASAMPTMDNTWTYEYVNSIYSLDEIANAAKLYGEGYESRAIRFCWNQQLDVILDGVVYYDVPRYFWYVYRAADLSKAKDISKTYTRDGVGYVFKTSIIPFRVGDTDRIDTVVSGGVDVIMQDRAGAELYSYDAVTTDMTDDLSRYQNITHQYDFAALAIFETYRPYLGKFKITNKTKAMFVNMFTALARKLASVSCLEYMKLISLDTNPDDSTRILLDSDGRAIRPFRGLDARIWMN